MKLATPSNLIRSVTVVLASLSFTVQAELEIQNAQYKSTKNAVYVKGKIKGDPVGRVYVVNAETDRLIGVIDTYSKGLQFKRDIPIGSTERVPCMVQVQTRPPGGGFFGNFGNTSPGVYNIQVVGEAPDHC